MLQPAHQSLVSELLYDRKHSDFLLTGGYDKKLHCWNMRSDTPTLAKTFGALAFGWRRRF